MSEFKDETLLDHRLPVPDWYSISAILIVFVGALARLLRLDTYLLNVREARWSFDAWSLFSGHPLPSGQHLPESGPFVLLWNAFAFLLFGDTDATARVGSALLGIGTIILIFAFRRNLSRAEVIGIALVIAISPTMVFTSRTAEPGIAAAFFAVLILVALMKINEGSIGWAAALGIAIAALYAVGPLGVTTLIALGAALLISSLNDRKHRHSPITRAMDLLAQNRTHGIGVVAGLLIGLLVFFTRGFTSPGSLIGIVTTGYDWGKMLVSGPGTVPAVFYFWSLLLYETIAVVIAIASAILLRNRDLEEHQAPALPSLFLVVWFAVALLLSTVSATRDTGATVIVVLPVLMLAGLGLGRLVELIRNATGMKAVASAIVIVALVAYSLNAMIGLSFTRGQSGAEPLAHDTPTRETEQFLHQVMRLSRDISIENVSNIDPTGRYGLTIKVTPEYQWPFTWYFRDFPQFSVTPAGGFTADTDLAIAPTAEVMDKLGLTSSSLPWINKPGDPLAMMKSGTILRTGLNPANWGEAWNYMVRRETTKSDNPRTLTYGYGVRIMNKLTTNAGPYNLFDGTVSTPGDALGQLDQPSGITVGMDGTIYVLNAGNARIDRYDEDGQFLGIWNGQVDAPLQLSWVGTQGGTGLATGPDGLIYIADTWNHAVVVVSPNGKVARVLGSRGIVTDIGDGADPQSSPGLFFGPRDVAISQDRIYVTDTGNERVQVFAKDGTFLFAFGGFGDKNGQFVEPTGIAMDPQGNLWIADSGNARLQIFDADGNWIASHTVPEWVHQSGVERINMLRFDAYGRLFFTTPLQGVWVWSNEGSQQLQPTIGMQPGGIAFDNEGRLLITYRDIARVSRIVPDIPADFGIQATPEIQATPQD